MTRKRAWLLNAGFVAAVLVGSALPAAADTYGFSCITNNSAGDCAILQNQLAMEVTSGSGVVNFKFTNAGPAASSITAVFFDDLAPPLLGNPSVITDSGSGVSFLSGDPKCSPVNLPGGNSFSFTTAYCADSTSPTQPMGVNPGEWVNISYTLQGGATFADVIAALNAGTYRVGIHVQGFAGGGSESGISRPPQVPELSTLMFVTGGGAIAALVRRRRARKA